MPDIIYVQKTLPLGAAAVLINRDHAYTEIYLLIHAQQKKMFDAIDGMRPVGAIVFEHGQPTGNGEPSVERDSGPKERSDAERKQWGREYKNSR